MLGKAVKRGPADRAHQNRVRRKTSLQGIVGQRIFAVDVGNAADIFASDAEGVTEGLRDGFENEHRLIGHFRTNAIAGENGKFKIHGYFRDNGLPSVGYDDLQYTRLKRPTGSRLARHDARRRDAAAVWRR